MTASKRRSRRSAFASCTSQAKSTRAGVRWSTWPGARRLVRIVSRTAPRPRAEPMANNSYVLQLSPQRRMAPSYLAIGEITHDGPLQVPKPVASSVVMSTTHCRVHLVLGRVASDTRP